MNQVRARPSVNMPLYGTAAMDLIYPVDNLANFMVALEHERKLNYAENRFVGLTL